MRYFFSAWNWFKMQAVSINCIISDVLTYRLVDGEGVTSWEIPSCECCFYERHSKNAGHPKSGAFLLYTEARVTVSASEFDASILDGDVGESCWEMLWKKTKVWIASASYWKRRSPHQIAFSLRIALLPPSMGFWMQVFSPGRPGQVEGDLHRRLCISGLISWGWSIVVMMRQIWFGLYLTIKLKLLNFCGLGGLGVKELEEGQKTVLLKRLLSLFMFLNECFFVQNSHVHTAIVVIASPGFDRSLIEPLLSLFVGPAQRWAPTKLSQLKPSGRDRSFFPFGLSPHFSARRGSQKQSYMVFVFTVIQE